MSEKQGNECLICKEEYNEDKFSPRSLSCGHSFCLSCLEKDVNQKGKLICSVCRKETLIPENGLSGLPKIFQLIPVISKSSPPPSHSKEEGCQKCDPDDQLPITHYCQECHLNLCKNHAALHQESKKSSSHHLHQLSSNSETNNCKLHPKEELRLLCVQDDVLICIKCVSEKPHKGHEFKQLDEAYKAEKTRIGHQLDHVRQNLKQSQDTIQSLKKIKEQVEQDKKLHLSEVERYFNELEKLARERKQKLIQEILSISSEKEDILSEQMKFLALFGDKTTATISLIEECLRNTNKAYVISQSAQNSQSLSTINQELPNFTLKTQSDIKIIFPERLAAELKVAGELQYAEEKNICPALCGVSGLGIKEADLGQLNTFIITSRDRMGRLRAAGGDIFQVDIKADYEKEIPVSIEDKKDGTYVASYTLPKESKFMSFTLKIQTGKHDVGLFQVSVKSRLLTWDDSTVIPNILIEADKSIIQSIPILGSVITCKTKQGWREGKHMWEIHILKIDKVENFRIGFITDKYDQWKKPIGNHDHGAGFLSGSSCSRSLQWTKMEARVPTFRENTVLELTLDLDQRMFCAGVKGWRKTLLFKNLPVGDGLTYYPAISFYDFYYPCRVKIIMK